MKTKNLANWTEAFKVAETPWLRSDWYAVLNILWKLLHKENSIEEDQYDNDVFTFQEMFHLSEVTFGSPQLVVVCDTKQTIAENQLAIFTALCVFKYSTSTIDPKSLSVNSTCKFNIDVADSSCFCVSCNNRVSLIERYVINGKIWHRSCMKCRVCRQQVYRGTFLLIGSNLFECVEHLVFHILFQNPMYQLNQKKKSIDSNTNLKTPPPRPPPPKFCKEATDDKFLKSDVSDRLIDSSKVANKLPSTNEKNWEVLSYPAELNPFGSDEDDDEFEVRKFDIRPIKTANNPFFDNSDDEEEDEISKEKESIIESDIEEVENPVDRVVSSSSTFSPARNTSTEHSRNPFDDTSEQEDSISQLSVIKPSTSFNSSSINDKNDLNTNFNNKQKSDKDSIDSIKKSPPPPKPPRISDFDSPAQKNIINDFSDFLSYDNKKYIAPLFIDFRNDAICSSTLDEVLTQLRRLNLRWNQLETTGQRIETQILRNITAGNFEWKKNKIAEEFLNIIEQKCEAFKIESVLVRKYMDFFVSIVHEEIELQMKTHDNSNKKKWTELTELLVLIMQIKNDLLTPRLVPTVVSKSPDSYKILKKFTSPSLFKKGVKQTMKSLKKKF